MKRTLSILLGFIFSLIHAFAADEVSMVSYEQNWNDHQGSLALKNNTDQPIKNLEFTIEYLNMKGIPLDYKTFSQKVDIAPQKTKKINIPAYESQRQYYYYKSEGLYSNRSFNIKFELISVNKNTSQTKSSKSKLSTNDSNNSNIMGFILIPFVLIILGLYVLVPVIANRQRRNPAIWLFLCFLFTPFFILIILLIMGKNKTNNNSF